MADPVPTESIKRTVQVSYTTKEHVISVQLADGSKQDLATADKSNGLTLVKGVPARVEDQVILDYEAALFRTE